MLVASFLFAAMGVLVKLASERFSAPELVFYRSLFGLVSIYFAIMLSSRQWLTPLQTPQIKGHVKRGLAGFAALVMFFHAIAHLPLPTAITLNYTSPLFLAAITAWWLKERHGRALSAALLLGFAGIVLLLRPVWGEAYFLDGLIGLASGILAALAYFNVRELGRAGEPEWRIVFYFALISTLAAAVWMALAGFTVPALNELPLLLAIGAIATSAQLAMTRAYRLGNTMTVGALAYSTVGFAALYGVLLFGDRLPLGAWIGMMLIVLAGVAGIRFGRTATPVE